MTASRSPEGVALSPLRATDSLAPRQGHGRPIRGYGSAMTECSRVMRCQPTDVFAVLSDGWSYGLWVVGAARIREVDAGWPREGTKIDHSVGVWPTLLDDATYSRGAEAPHWLRLRARAWPTGEAHIEFHIDPHDSGCVVTISEHAVSGPAVMIPGPVQSAMLKWRNSETLRRLAFIAEGRSRS